MLIAFHTSFTGVGVRVRLSREPKIALALRFLSGCLVFWCVMRDGESLLRREGWPYPGTRDFAECESISVHVFIA